MHSNGRTAGQCTRKVGDDRSCRHAIPIPKIRRLAECGDQGPVLFDFRNSMIFLRTPTSLVPL
jgi:hypothetical protein